jgi:hypothetical protein
MLALVFAVVLALAGVTRAETQQQSGVAAARRDAQQLLGRLRLPGDVTRIAKPPSYVSPLVPLANGVTTLGAYWATDAASWTTDARPRRIIDYVEAHEPAGANSENTGSGSNSENDTTSLNVDLGWAPVPKRLYDRTMTVTVVTLRHGPRSIVVAQTLSR